MHTPMIFPTSLIQQDTTQVEPGTATAYDSVWADPIPTQTASGFEQVMLSHDKLYVVLGVVLLIWFGLIFFILYTDRKLDRLERKLDAHIPEQQDVL